MKNFMLISFLNDCVYRLRKIWVSTSIVISFISIAPFCFASIPYCDSFFGNGIQAHGADNYIQFDYNAQLLNGYPYVQTNTLINNKWSIKKSCGSVACTKVGSGAQDMTSGTMLETTVTNEVIVAPNQKIIVGSNNILNYGKVVLSERSVATFKPQTAPYVITQLEVGYKSKLRLPAGEYWISRLRLEVEGRIDVIGEGQVTLYVIDSMWVPLNFKINDNTKNPAKMAIYTFSDSNYYTGSKTHAFIRSEGEVILNYRSTIVGGVLGKFIRLEAESQIVYDPAAVRAVQFGDYCRAFPFPLDADQPVVVIDQYDDITTLDHITVTGTIIDSGEHASGVGDVSINISGAWIPLPLTGNSFSVEIPLERGDNWFSFLVYDLAGNEVFLTYNASRVLPE